MFVWKKVICILYVTYTVRGFERHSEVIWVEVENLKDKKFNRGHLSNLPHPTFGHFTNCPRLSWPIKLPKPFESKISLAKKDIDCEQVSSTYPWTKPKITLKSDKSLILKFVFMAEFVVIIWIDGISETTNGKNCRITSSDNELSG